MRHDLVEERKTFVYSPEVDERDTLLQHAQRLDVSITKRATDLDGALPVTQSLLAITQQLGRDDALNPSQPTLLRTLGHVGQQRDRALQPSRGDSNGPSPGLVKGEMQRHEGGAANIAFLDEGAVRAFSRSNALFEMARPKGSLRELLIGDLPGSLDAAFR